MGRPRKHHLPVREEDPAEEKRRSTHPNFGSRHATPTSRRVDLHYVRLQLLSRWTWERYKRLANLMKITPYELASIACIPHRTIRNWEENAMIPDSTGAYAQALVLTILEHHVGGVLLDTIENPFPSSTSDIP